MTDRFEVQARLVRRRGMKVVCDESRSVRVSALSDAIVEADGFVAGGFTAWIYRLDAGPGISPVYRLEQRRDPGT